MKNVVLNNTYINVGNNSVKIHSFNKNMFIYMN